MLEQEFRNSDAPVKQEGAAVPEPAAATGPVKISIQGFTNEPITPPAGDSFDLDDASLYLNRELTWLNFNLRVLHEGEDESNPLLERLRFVAIICANLDEFFMKRIGGLKQQLGAGLSKLTIDGRTPEEQITACHEIIRHIEERKNEVLNLLLPELRQNDIFLLDYYELSEDEKEYVREEFFQDIFPLVTPQGIDPAHPFPFISNLSCNLLVTLQHPNHEGSVQARVKIPVGPDVPRFLRIRNSYRFVRLEEVISNNLDLLFPQMDVLSCDMFRVTRNAVTELDEEEAEDLLSMIETELRYRKFAPMVRLQVTPQMDPVNRGMLAAELGLDADSDVYEVHGIMGKSDLHEIAGLHLPYLKFPPYRPIDHPRLKDKTSIFHNLRTNGPILLFHPFESFTTSVERFLKEASEDPKVRAIKMTLYRTSRRSKVIRYLVNAARNGKQVAVVVELKARFDEAANIQWANHLEEAGIHVTYGVVGLKTHAKVILVVRKDYNGIRRYAHIGTGNYHEVTARQYTDLGLLTCDEDVGQDLTEFFNFLSTGFTPRRAYSKIITAAIDLKRSLLSKIRREIQNRKKGLDSCIRMKTNALEDPDITKALYQAAKAGVKVELIIRDTCRLRPGIPGLSESARVISIVGRFLEHSRVYYFLNGGREEYFIGSADCMKRNLESRVEVITPVEDPSLCLDLEKILTIQLQDRRDAWELQPDGSYIQLQPINSDEAIGSQEIFMAIARKRGKEGQKLKKIKSLGKSKKESWYAY